MSLVEAGNGPEPDVAGCDACILAGSVHAGRYQKPLLEAAQRQVVALPARPGLFLSVSLTAAGTDAAERGELDRIAEAFLAETGWKGAQVAQVAGALRFSEYGFFEYWAMLWISRRKDRTISGRKDVELTDWNALDALIDGWLAEVTDGH